MSISDIIQFIQQGQHFFRETIIGELQNINLQSSLFSGFNLVCAAFVYGILHAVGPGHGKVIVSSYVLASNHNVSRGLMMVMLSSLMQAIVAIIVVISFYYILNLARAQAEYATNILEIISYTIVSIIGFNLVWRGIKEFLKYANHRANHHHDGNNKCCAHSHFPHSQAHSSLKLSSFDFISIIFSIGIRPCSGAVLVLFLACMLGLVLPGIMAVMAMALGTAITTSLLVIITANSKSALLNKFDAADRQIHIVHGAMNLCGGILVILMCGLFLWVAIENLQTPLENRPDKTRLPLMHLPDLP
jgi:nickel/cobalt transporter (NicO) family protein